MLPLRPSGLIMLNTASVLNFIFPNLGEESPGHDDSIVAWCGLLLCSIVILHAVLEPHINS